MAKVETVKIKGGAEYAKVADRVKAFREMNPRAEITNSFDRDEEGNFYFKCRVVADLAEEHSPCADAIAMLSAKDVKSEKGFEKGQTIAVGRALSFLGYLGSGEIASSEEMELFEEHQREKRETYVEQAIETLTASGSLPELQKAWLVIPREIKEDPRVIAKKDELKSKFIAGE